MEKIKKIKRVLIIASMILDGSDFSQLELFGYSKLEFNLSLDIINKLEEVFNE